jgi:predicted nuclease with TOPRIM domain
MGKIKSAWLQSVVLTLDSAEAAMALRQRLNETVEQLDALKKDHLELQVKFDEQSASLTIARSDCRSCIILCHYALTELIAFFTVNLVNKDQLEILASLRESVNGDKRGLEEATERLKSQIRELSDKNKMQLEQINKLLMEKVTLQSEGIDQRERLLERERNSRCVPLVFVIYSRVLTDVVTRDRPWASLSPMVKVSQGSWDYTRRMYI